VQRFQVIQEQRGALTFRIVKGGRYTEGALDEILAYFRNHLGADLRVDVEFVDQIDMIRTGKHLASVSRLGVDFQSNAPRPSEKLR
jgi:phenylacetate-CoA ligase